MNSLQEKMKILVESMAAVADDHLGTIHILRKHLYCTKLNLTTYFFFTKTEFFRQIKGIPFSTLPFDEIFML